MPKQSYALEAGQEKRLEISWKALWKDITVTHDGNVVGVIPNQKALAAGQEFRLLDGSTLKVQLVTKYMSTELRVLRNGQPLPGSASDPQTKLKTAYSVVYFVAGLNIVLGLLSLLLNIEILRELGIGFGSLLFGLVFLVLGFFVQRMSNAALIIAILLLVFDAVFGFVIAVSQGYTPSFGGIFVRIVLLIPMVQGVGAIRTLKRKSE